MSETPAPYTVDRASQWRARARTEELALPSGATVVARAPEFVTAFASGLIPGSYRPIIARYREDGRAVMGRDLPAMPAEQRQAAQIEMMMVIDATTVAACVDPPVRFVTLAAEQVNVDEIPALDRLAIWRWSVGLPLTD